MAIPRELEEDSLANRDQWLSLDTPFGSKTNAQKFFVVCTVGFALWHIATNLLINEAALWQNAIHFGGFAILCSVIFPARIFGKQSVALDLLIDRKSVV